MSVNLMELLKGAVGDQAMQQMGGLLGQPDAQKTSGLFDGAAASILGGLMKKMGTPAGSQQVFEATRDADDSILDKLGDLLGGGQATQQVEQQGSGIMDLVFGNQQSGIIAALSRALGLDKSMIGKLLTMVAPMLLGVISRSMKSASLDAGGLSSLLGEQSQHLGNYLPEGMGSTLGLNLPAPNAPSVATPAAPVTNAPAAGGGGSLAKILIPLLILGAIAFAIFQMSGNDNGADEAMEEAVPEVMIDMDDMNLDEELKLDTGNVIVPSKIDLNAPPVTIE